MKKLILLLLAGLLLAPSEMFADKYNSKKVASATPPPMHSGRSEAGK